MTSTKQTPYDIDRWDETSLTWSPVAHAQDVFEALDARDKLAETHPDARFRVRNKKNGTTSERPEAVK